MSFQLIDLESYLRREHFEHFLEMKLSYSATVEIDVTALRAAARLHGIRAYPAQIWMLTTAAQQVPEFRMSLDDQGKLGIWDELAPMFTVLNPESGTFSGLWTPYSKDFQTFYQDCDQVMARYGDGSLQPQPESVPNALNISSIPWLGFTSFNLNLPTDYLLPILTIGKYAERDARTFMPLAVQVHHAVCDGCHLARFVEQVQTIADDAGTWISGPPASVATHSEENEARARRGS